VIECFATNFAQVLGIRLVPGGLTPADLELADELLAVKYGTDEWNLGARRSYGVMVSAKAKGGVVSFSADIEDGIIRATRIQGDFLVSDRMALEHLAESGRAAGR
jgi:hypothetical protein